MACYQTLKMNINAPNFNKIFIISKLSREPTVAKIIESKTSMLKD